MVKLIINTLSSLKSAIMLIVIITLLSVGGTLLPQNLEAANYLSLYPKTAKLILAFGFDDMYHSAAFQTALWLLSLSAFFCVLSRRKAIKHKLFNRLAEASEKEIKALVHIKIPADLLKTSWQAEFKQQKTSDTGVKIYYKPSGRLSLMGSMFIHAGLLVLLAGGLIGLYCGVETTIYGSEGDKAPVAPVSAVKAAKKADQLARKARTIREFSPNDPRLKEMRSRVEQLQNQYYSGLASPAFTVVFNKLWVEKYQDKSLSGIKSWNSNISFIGAGGKNSSDSFIIKVNHPVSYKDYTFYQASWGKKYGKIKLLVEPSSPQSAADNASFTLELSPGRPLSLNPAAKLLNGGGADLAQIELKQFFSDFRIVDGSFVNMSNELLNPAAMIVGYKSNGTVLGRAWAFAKDKSAMTGHFTSLPYRFTFLEAETEYESVLQMAHDPGKPLVWLGCVIMSLGMIMSFYIAFIEYWAVACADGTVMLAVSGNRPPNLLRQRLKNLELRLCRADNMAKTNAEGVK